MPHIKRILFPVDFSDSSNGAARYVEAFAGRFEAEIMLLHAVGMGEHNLASELLPGRQAELDRFQAEEFSCFTTQRVCVIEDPSTAIARAAQSWRPDLVMMPTHGLGFFRRHLLGSVTAKALHDLACPLWTSVHAEAAPPLEKIHCRRILCALDLSESSCHVLKWAAWLAGQYQASLGVVHALPPIDASGEGWYVGEDLARQASDQVRTRIEEFLEHEQIRANQVYVSSGNPAVVAADAAADLGADLLVIGRHGNAGFAGDLFQHACAILRESPCPVVSI